MSDRTCRVPSTKPPSQWYQPPAMSTSTRFAPTWHRCLGSCNAGWGSDGWWGLLLNRWLPLWTVDGGQLSGCWYLSGSQQVGQNDAHLAFHGSLLFPWSQGRVTRCGALFCLVYIGCCAMLVHILPGRPTIGADAEPHMSDKAKAKLFGKWSKSRNVSQISKSQKSGKEYHYSWKSQLESAKRKSLKMLHCRKAKNCKKNRALYESFGKVERSEDVALPKGPLFKQCTIRENVQCPE